MPEQTTRQHRRRNPVALATILRKGGVHEKSRKAKRQKEKNKLRKEVSKVMATYRGHFFFTFLFPLTLFKLIPSLVWVRQKLL